MCLLMPSVLNIGGFAVKLIHKSCIDEFNGFSGSRLYRLDWLDYILHKLGVISQGRLKIKVKLLLSANRKSLKILLDMPRHWHNNG